MPHIPDANVLKIIHQNKPVSQKTLRKRFHPTYNLPMKPCSLKDIAQLAGVSYSTVSRALHNDPKISQTTKDKVQKIARKLNYQPNAFAVGLVNKRDLAQSHQGNLLLLAGHRDQDPLKHNTTYQHLLKHAKIRAKEHGYKLEYSWAHNPQTPLRRLAQILQAKNTSGIITLALSIDEIELNWSDYALARCAKFYPNEKCQIHHTTYHLRESMFLALNEIKKSGLSRIGLVVQPAAENKFNNLISSYFYNCYHLIYEEKPSIPPLINSAPQSNDEEDYAHFKQWYDTYKPEIILSFDNAFRVQAWLKRLSLKVPQNIGYVDLALRIDNPEDITGINLPYTQLAASAVDLIISQLHTNERGIPEAESIKGIYLYPTWNTGKSLI